MPSSFLAEVIEFRATDAYFISDLTTKKMKSVNCQDLKIEKYYYEWTQKA